MPFLIGRNWKLYMHRAYNARLHSKCVQVKREMLAQIESLTHQLETAKMIKIYYAIEIFQ